MSISSQRAAAALPLNSAHTLTPILSLGLQPLANNLVRAADAGSVDPTFPLELMWCDDLKLVQLSLSVPPSALFSEYLYLTSFSPTLVEAARQHVDAQVARRGLGPGDLAMEIGSNDGYLLQHYQAHGLDVLGIDPAQNVVNEAERKGVPTRCAFFGRELATELRAKNLRPKIVHANNVMAHVPDVEGVMAGLATLLRDDGVFVAETPYVRRMIEHLEFDTIYHEHLFYYSLTSFNGLLERNGLTVVDAEEIASHGGSLRITAARPGVYARSEAAAALLAEEERLNMGTFAYYRAFGEQVPELLAELRALIDRLASGNRSVAGYGAAAKATVMLNALGESARHVKWVADRSSVKQGRLVPGVRVPIVPVERVFTERPDYLIVFAWNYIDEIAEQLRSYREAGGRLVVPFPQPKVLD
jgi:2-polyprenyl-3-methyl-5-hydroxy-6-metoxy-1,4-benzoquinol methylase